MSIETYAHTLLFGDTLEAKLTPFPGGTRPAAGGPSRALAQVPDFPGRPARLSRPGKSVFPPLDRLQEESVRGEILHFFANHELLALELMALVLLRFPEAPEAFRMGLVRTIDEEQTHLKLYLGRMRDFGVEFGDLPVSDYFWKTLKDTRSPLEFVTQMSLTLEQANLDYALSFSKAFAEIGDLKTSAILEQVLKDEIGHVKHGLTWFNRWREGPSGESDWQAYLRLLPQPMTPRRAKGIHFAEEPRREAGLSEVFIRELSLHGGSKGRAPTIWWYNPHCDAEIARGKPGFTATRGAQALARDLETIPMFLASDQDTVVVSRLPNSAWIAATHAAGVKTPHFVEASGPSLIAKAVRSHKIGGLEPWGWSPDAFEAMKPFRERLVEVAGENSRWAGPLLENPGYAETRIAPIFSKSWSVEFLRDWSNENPHAFPALETTLGTTCLDEAMAFQAALEVLASGRTAMAKAPYGTSGIQVKQIRLAEELDGPLGGWIRNTLAEQSEIIIEPWLEKVADLSMQFVVEEGRTRLLEVRRFVTGSRNEYRGTYLGRSRPGLKPDELRLLHSVMGSWETLTRGLGLKMRDQGYRGPAGVDAMIWRDRSGELRFKPLIELNPRWTMGRVAIELERRFAPGVEGIFVLVPTRQVLLQGYSDASEFARALSAKHPLSLTGAEKSQRIQGGVLFTSDPSRALEVVAVLATMPNPELESLMRLS